MTPFKSEYLYINSAINDDVLSTIERIEMIALLFRTRRNTIAINDERDDLEKLQAEGWRIMAHELQTAINIIYPASDNLETLDSERWDVDLYIRDKNITLEKRLQQLYILWQSRHDDYAKSSDTSTEREAIAKVWRDGAIDFKNAIYTIFGDQEWE